MTDERAVSPARRPGRGRAARVAARAAPLPETARPVRPGLLGGTYRPLTEAGVRRIHEAALEAMETVGFADAPPSGVEILTGAGAVQGADGRIRIPRALVDDMLAKAARNVTLHGRESRHDLELSPARVYFGTAGAAVNVVEVASRTYRPSLTQDLFDSARIVDRLDNVHFFQRAMVCRDIEDPYELDLNSIYASCAGTTKHVGVSFTHPDFMADAFELIHMIAGGEPAWRERPFISNSNCFVVPPMKFATESCQVLEACVRGGMPMLLLSAGQAGATAPAPLAAAVVQAVAECLAGMVYVNAISPGHPTIFGTWPFVSDLRSGAMSGGSGEQALLTAACAQMHQYYGLPGGAAAGIADAKLPDMQAGWEQAVSNVMAGLSGLNMVYESVGMHASLLGFCLESLILGDDMLGQVQRCVRGIEVTDETISLDSMKAACLDSGPGHYLGSPQTLSVMQTEYIYPALGDRTSPKEWEEVGKPDLIEAATRKKNELLAQPSQAAFRHDLDVAIRRRFKIHLPMQ